MWIFFTRRRTWGLASQVYICPPLELPLPAPTSNLHIIYDVFFRLSTTFPSILFKVWTFWTIVSIWNCVLYTMCSRDCQELLTVQYVILYLQANKVASVRGCWGRRNSQVRWKSSLLLTLIAGATVPVSQTQFLQGDEGRSDDYRTYSELCYRRGLPKSLVVGC